MRAGPGKLQLSRPLHHGPAWQRAIDGVDDLYHAMQGVREMRLTEAMSFDPDFAGPADWAAMYRAHRLQVVPSFTPSQDPVNWKRPRLSEWTHFQEELVPDATFERWYGRDGDAARQPNMGLLTGRASDNIFVIDLDDYKNEEAG